MLFFIAEMVHELWFLAATATLIVVAVVLWNRPEPVPTTDEEEEAFELEHRIPVRTDGGRTLASWGMGMALLVAAIAVSTLLLSYFYLRAENPQWPPTGVDDPALGWAAVSLVAAIGAAIASGWARHQIRAGAGRSLVGGLAVSVVLTIGAGLALFVDLLGLDFSAQDHAYGSIFYLLAGALIVLAVIGLVVHGVVLVAAGQGKMTSRRHSAVTNTYRYTTVMAALWLVCSATLYLTPLVT